MIRFAILLCLLASPAAAGYCDDWREFRDGAQSSTTSEFWEFALVKYCAGGIPRSVLAARDQPGRLVRRPRQPETDTMQASLTLDMVAAHIDDWRGRCAAEYRTWDASTATVVRRVSHGKRVICPLPR